MDQITCIINEYVEPITTAPEFSIVIGYIPTLVTAVRTMSIPGAEKKDLVLNALYTFVDVLVTKEVIDAEKASEFKEFITLVAPAAIETILGVQKSTISDTTTSGVEEVKQTKCGAFIPILFQMIINILMKSKKVKQDVSTENKSDVKPTSEPEPAKTSETVVAQPV